MDEEAKRAIAKHIDPSQGIESQLRDRLREHYGRPNYQPSSKQKGAIRDYYASSDAPQTEAVKFTAGGKRYVKTAENKFMPADKRGDVIYSPQSNTLYVLGDDGKIKGKADNV